MNENIDIERAGPSSDLGAIRNAEPRNLLRARTKKQVEESAMEVVMEMSVAQYAKHRNVSKNMVYRYIQDGQISVECLVEGRPLKIEAELADEDLAGNLGPRMDGTDDFDDFGNGEIDDDNEQSPGEGMAACLVGVTAYCFAKWAGKKGYSGLEKLWLKWPVRKDKDLQEIQQVVADTIDRRKR